MGCRDGGGRAVAMATARLYPAQHAREGRGTICT